MASLTDIAPGSSTSRDASRWSDSVLSVAATEEPLTQEEAKAHCKVPGSPEDFTNLVVMAREFVENDTQTRLVTQTRIQYFDFFPDVMQLRDPPVASVTSITYVDQSGVTQTLSSTVYQSDLTSRPAIIMPAYGQVWPTITEKLKCIAVTFVCGQAANAVPAMAKQAMLLRIGSLYENREMHRGEEQAYEALIAKLCWRRF